LGVAGEDYIPISEQFYCSKTPTRKDMARKWAKAQYEEEEEEEEKRKRKKKKRSPISQFSTRKEFRRSQDFKERTEGVGTEI
jgi:hypothetical protein